MDLMLKPDQVPAACTSCSFPLPPRLSSGRHPDCHQPAAKDPAAVRASAEEAHPQRHVLLPQAKQDHFHLDQTGLLLIHLQSRSNSGQKPIAMEGLAKTRERSAVWKVMDIEYRTLLPNAEERMCGDRRSDFQTSRSMKRSHEDTLKSTANNRAVTNQDL